MTGVSAIRSAFLDYFARNGHDILASGPLVPRNDPTLMFTNAGMVQFKNVFTGLEKRSCARAATAQKCVRAGGKHNDLDNVGYTARHHTFFEMLGNFSFGDYFKDSAIELAWNLITREFGLPVERLMIAVYAEDDQAFDLWKKIAGLPDHRIVRIATSDNFWTMGDVGPCGPCSEIFFDHGDHIPGGPPGSPDQDGDRFVEIWNLVFMQFEQREGGERVLLPHPSIDTGMGLERISAILQGVHDNYDIDLFRALISASVEMTGISAEGPHRVSHRIIADHLRAASFLIADGVLPSNEGRGYVLRRIMRRAMRHAHMLGSEDALMWRLVPALTHEMGEAYPELIRAGALVTETLKREEERFRHTLARGLSILRDETVLLASGDVLSGKTAFRLYDTYGFPLDLTEDVLKAQGIAVDKADFDKEMARQRDDARKAWSGSGESLSESVWFKLRDQSGATDFLGYEGETAQAVVTSLVLDGRDVEELKSGETGFVILNQTPFYGESGGQLGDRGWMGAEGVNVRVDDTQKRLGDLIVHEVSVIDGPLRPGQALRLTVDREWRAGIRVHHSATHLLHEALREVLGDHVTQKGSLVAPDRLRFDFSHSGAVSREELVRVEDLANAIIMQNGDVAIDIMGVDEASAAGAIALFGEKYGEEVRVVSMGRSLAEKGGLERDVERAYSMELCGGTHVRRVGDIGLIVIVAESAVAAGVRRIEALAGAGARAHLMEQDRRVRNVASVLRSSPEEIERRVTSLVDQQSQMKSELVDARRQMALAGSSSILDGVIDIGPVKLLTRVLQGISAKELRDIASDGRRLLGSSGIVAFVGIGEDGKAAMVVGLAADLQDRFDAVDLVRKGAIVLGGQGGGGRPDMAQAGGPHGHKAEDALAAVRAAIDSLCA